MTPDQIYDLIIANGGSPEAAKATAEAAQAEGQLTAFQEARAALFPEGIPRRAPTAAFSATELPPLSGHRSPSTGAFIPEGVQGVIVNPSAGDPQAGVIYGPNSGAAGSPEWLREATNWDDKKINRWRKRLFELNYPVAQKGPFDQQLFEALDLYHRSLYFYGKPLPLPADEGGRPGPDDIYDPVERRNDARTLLATIFGEEPEDDEVRILDHWMAKKLRNALQKGATPEHARLRVKEQLSERVSRDPEAALFIDQANEIEKNTQWIDSVSGMAQFLSGGV